MKEYLNGRFIKFDTEQEYEEFVKTNEKLIFCSWPVDRAPTAREMEHAVKIFKVVLGVVIVALSWLYVSLKL